MKSDISYSKIIGSTITWFSWNEICDCCGKLIHSKDDVKSNKKPNLDEEDLCLSCLRDKYCKIKKEGIKDV